MDPALALADLTEVSSQIEAAVIADVSGEPVAANVPDPAARALARAALELLGDAAQVEAVVSEGCVFASRDGARIVAASTARSAAAAVVRHDLGGCLGSLAEAETRKRRPRTRARSS